MSFGACRLRIVTELGIHFGGGKPPRRYLLTEVAGSESKSGVVVAAGAATLTGSAAVGGTH